MGKRVADKITKFSRGSPEISLNTVQILVKIPKKKDIHRLEKDKKLLRNLD